jgi:hypothetical protein
MESKKINQLATELAPDLSDLTIIGDPSTGISRKITLSQMASLFTGTVEEYPNLASFPLVGTADTIYIALDTNVLYRWNTGTNAYVELSPNIINSLVFNDANGFDGTISLVGSTATLTITTALTTGSVGFIGASGALLQDNANFFWNNSTKRLGINTNAPTTAIDTFGSGIITRVNGTSTNNAFIGFASAGTNRWSIGNVQSDNRFRIYNEATTSELISVLSTGEFGIGIANPTTKLHIDGGATALIANLDANVSVAKSISFRSDNSNRFNIEVSGTESGSNAGANLFIRRYSDAGALIDTPLTITRSTGLITLATALSATSSTFSGLITAQSGILFNTTQTISTSGSIGFNSAQGLFIYGKTGSSYDLKLYNGVGSAFIQIPTGTQNVEFLSSILVGASSIITGTDRILELRGSGSGANTLLRYSDGTTAKYSVGFNLNEYIIFDDVAGVRRLQIASNGAFTFTSSVNGSSISSITNDTNYLTLQSTKGGQTIGLRTISTTKSYFCGSNYSVADNFEIYDLTASASRLAITSGGNVGIGIINPLSKLDVSGTVKNQAIKTNSGVVAVPNNTATTLYTFSAYGLYMFYSDLVNGQGVPLAYSSYAIICFDGSVARIVQQTNGSLYTLTLSGNNIQATQTSGLTQNCNYIFQLIGT